MHAAFENANTWGCSPVLTNFEARPKVQKLKELSWGKESKKSKKVIQRGQTSSKFPHEQAAVDRTVDENKGCWSSAWEHQGVAKRCWCVVTAGYGDARPAVSPGPGHAGTGAARTGPGRLELRPRARRAGVGARGTRRASGVGGGGGGGGASSRSGLERGVRRVKRSGGEEMGRTRAWAPRPLPGEATWAPSVLAREGLLACFSRKLGD